MNVPVRALTHVLDHRPPTRDSFRRNITAVWVALRRFAPEFGNPQQIKGSSHVDLLIHHGAEPRSRPFALQVRFFPALGDQGPEIVIHHRGPGTEAQIQGAKLVVG
jgi:hypothetical protein